MRVLVLVLLLTLLPELAGAATMLTIYSDRHRETDQTLLAGFTAETGIAVDLVDEELEDLLERLRREGSQSPADLVILVGAGTLAQLAEDGGLLPLRDDKAVMAVPDNLRDGIGRWVGLVWWARGIAYRVDRFKPEDVARYEDLADPKFQGQLLVRSAASPYNRALAASLVAADGVADTEAWAAGVVANLARPPQGGDTDQILALARGDGGAALVNTRYWGRLGASDKVTERDALEGLALVLPNQQDRGASIDVIGAGVLRNAPHPGPAQALIDYLLRPAIQEALAASGPDFPASPAAAVPDALKPLGHFRTDQGAVRRLGALGGDAEQVLERAGWE
jgi:iron(III) transport system substrate-binding protein